MRRLLFTILAMAFGSAFATSEADQAAQKAAMNECLKTKTQQECTDAGKVAKKASTEVKSGTTASTN